MKSVDRKPQMRKYHGFQRLAADAEAARQKRLERLRAEAKAAEEAGALGLKKGEAD